MLALNIPCIYVVGVASSNGSKAEDHAWNKIYYNGHWYILDVTWTRLNDMQYFNMDDKFAN